MFDVHGMLESGVVGRFGGEVGDGGLRAAPAEHEAAGGW